MGPDDTIYLTDDGDHTVRKCTLDGKRAADASACRAQPAPFMSGEPFHRCTHTALSPDGDIYVSDGYGNACVHKFSPDGKLIDVVGRAGLGPGRVQPAAQHRAATPTAGCTSPTARTTASRSSTATAASRRSGTTCTGRARMYMPPGTCPICYVGEIGPYYAFNRARRTSGPRLSILGPRRQAVADHHGARGGRRAGPVPLAARARRRFARRPLRRRSGLHGVAVDVSRAADAGDAAHAAEAGTRRRRRRA